MSIRFQSEIIAQSNLTTSNFITNTDYVKIKFYSYFVLLFTYISHIQLYNLLNTCKKILSLRSTSNPSLDLTTANKHHAIVSLCVT